MNSRESEIIQKHINNIRVAQGTINESLARLQTFIHNQIVWDTKK